MVNTTVLALWTRLTYSQRRMIFAMDQCHLPEMSVKTGPNQLIYLPPVVTDTRLLSIIIAVQSNLSVKTTLDVRPKWSFHTGGLYRQVIFSIFLNSNDGHKY